MCKKVAHDGWKTGVAGVLYCDFRPKRKEKYDMRYIYTRDLQTIADKIPMQLAERLMKDAEEVYPVQLFYVVRACDERFDVYKGHVK